MRGRYDGGSFEARCAAAEGGSRWPPAPPPVFLAEITGTGERGAFSSEVYVSYCTRPPL